VRTSCVLCLLLIASVPNAAPAADTVQARAKPGQKSPPVEPTRTAPAQYPPVTAAAAQPTPKAQREAAEAAASYDRGRVWFQQGAFQEAEKEFRNAEKKADGKVPEYIYATAYTYLKLHRPEDARKRYENFYKKDPRNTRALVGLAAACEEEQNYREAVRMWQRYVKMDLPSAERDEGVALLRTAQELFAERYEIAENPGGGAPNKATAQEELEMGLAAAQEIASSGVALVEDDAVVGYVRELSQVLVGKSKNFPSNYQLFVLDSRTVNAMAMPGFIFVYRGSLDVVQSEAELAGILAHEIGHAVGHHGAKQVTRAVDDKQQAEDLKASRNRFLRFLGRMSESGSTSGQLAFSREQEAQADRLAVHIAFDAGYEPTALADFFQKLESISPSSRNSWELMQRTHPFSIDRIHTITEYAALLPERPTRRSSPAFDRMKGRLSKLAPPPDATGQVRPALEATKTPPPARAGAPIPYTLPDTPFAGEIPAGWTGRKTEAGTIVFEGEKGTEAYEATVEVQVAPKSQVPGATLDEMTQRVAANLAKRPEAQVKPPRSGRTNDGRPTQLVAAAFAARDAQGGRVAMRQASQVIEYPDWFIVLSYFAAEQFFDKFLPEVEFIVDHLRMKGS
jgi:predicted Zn-dependent protease